MRNKTHTFRREDSSGAAWGGGWTHFQPYFLFAVTLESVTKCRCPVEVILSKHKNGVDYERGRFSFFVGGPPYVGWGILQPPFVWRLTKSFARSTGWAKFFFFCGKGGLKIKLMFVWSGWSRTSIHTAHLLSFQCVFSLLFCFPSISCGCLAAQPHKPHFDSPIVRFILLKIMFLFHSSVAPLPPWGHNNGWRIGIKNHEQDKKIAPFFLPFINAIIASLPLPCCSSAVSLYVDGICSIRWAEDTFFFL